MNLTENKMTTDSNLDDSMPDERPGTPAPVKPKPARRSKAKAPGNPVPVQEPTAPRAAAVGHATASKSDIVVNKLRAAKGATIETLMTATGWQAHSVRGFLSGTVRKKLGLPLENEIGKDGQRRYRLAK
ncbi:DUF3489 domain-containing protein [Mesorhizobium sp. KR9-304]|uniref:DUF3489 domain-containing protein n=1 Tax=Mesorhizobium sp. KR9-304 TaxID=3156614 RepID=UPI0032B45EF9